MEQSMNATLYAGKIWYFLSDPTASSFIATRHMSAKGSGKATYGIVISLNGLLPSVIPHFRKYKQHRLQAEDALFQETGLSYERTGSEVHSFFQLHGDEIFEVELEERGEEKHILLYTHFTIVEEELRKESHHPRLDFELVKKLSQDDLPVNVITWALRTSGFGGESCRR